MPGQSQKSQLSPSLRVRNHSLGMGVIQSLLKVSLTIDDVSPPVTPDAPARKRVCLPVAAASQTSVRKPNLDISDIGSVFQSEHQRCAVCPRNVSFKTKIEIVNNRWTPVKSFQYPVRVLNAKNLPSWCDRFP